MNRVYAITDLDGYVSQVREAAAQTIADLDGYVSQVREVAAQTIEENNEENLDNYITINQMINMVKEECLGFDDEDRPILDEDCNEKIFENTIVWIHDVALAKLAAKNLVECAWDDQTNEMIFWSSETKENKNVRTKNPTRKNKKTKGSDSGL